MSPSGAVELTDVILIVLDNNGPKTGIRCILFRYKHSTCLVDTFSVGLGLLMTFVDSMKRNTRCMDVPGTVWHQFFSSFNHAKA